MGAGVVRLLVEPDAGDGPVLRRPGTDAQVHRAGVGGSVAPDGAASGQIVHGHWPPASNALLVVNVYVRRHRLPELLRPADRRGVGGPRRQRAARGEGRDRIGAVEDSVPDTAFPPESFNVNDAVLGTTGSENVTVGAAETGLLDEPAAGVPSSPTARPPAARCRNDVDRIIRTIRLQGRETLASRIETPFPALRNVIGFSPRSAAEYSAASQTDLDRRRNGRRDPNTMRRRWCRR